MMMTNSPLSPFIRTNKGLCYVSSKKRTYNPLNWCKSTKLDLIIEMPKSGGLPYEYKKSR